jgi:class 3 adenylate cyclase/tetratricopeptide (TPR) repeat protein
MLVCDNCGEQNPDRARFCLACGRALVDRPAARESRKTVTVLFCDVTGSTALGERLDPESQRAVMSSYFEGMRAVLERHGGTVEKFIGDAVMAVFGIPTVHEDDALRAVSAAAAMRERLDELNRQLERERGIRIAMRIGVNTGEVVAGDPGGGQKFVTGDPVVVAKRLESAAAPGDVLLGEETARLVRGAARLEPLGPVALKGKAAPVTAWRLLDVDADAPAFARRLDAPLVGREDELMRLIDLVDAVAVERACRLVTVVADAGVGKSRLARELAGRLGDRASFLTGRCLPYGDGITFWPLREILAQAGGLDAAAALGGGEEAGLVVDLVRGAIGSGSGDTAGGEETFWAVRKLVEALARDRPLVLCVEDVHWAEPTLLELLEYLSAWIRDAPVLLLCLSRPDLAEEHPSWPGVRADSLLPLPPLTESETGELVDALAREAGLDESMRERIAGAAEGNPLFVEQLTELLAEEPDALHSLPPTIHALLAARLDRLGRDERAVLERAAVMGREFWRRAVVELTPDEERGDVGSHLLALVRKNLLRPDAPASGAEDGFRFSHVLVRDTAYAAMPKEARADLHERFAGWIEANLAERAAELDEIVGYHLEQAYRYREQLAPVDERGRSLAERAGERLGRAGRRAFARDDMPAALSLLDRAVALVTEQEPARLELLRELSSALWTVGDVARAESLLNGLIEAASESGHRSVEWYALLDRAARHELAGAAEADLLAVAEAAIPVFEQLGDDLGLARAWRRIAAAQVARHRFEAAEHASERALHHARLAADLKEEARSVDQLCTVLLYGPTPAGEALARCEEMLVRARRSRLMEANVTSSVAGLLAMRGRFDESRDLVDRARRTYDELGLVLAGAGLSNVAAESELLAGKPAAAAALLYEGYDTLPAVAKAHRSALLAEAMYALSRFDDARVRADECRAAAGSHALSHVCWRAVHAGIAAREERFEEAEQLAREAVELVDRMDALNVRGDARIRLAEVLHLADRHDEASAVTREALIFYERKGNLVSAERAKALLAERVR